MGPTCAREMPRTGGDVRVRDPVCRRATSGRVQTEEVGWWGGAYRGF